MTALGLYLVAVVARVAWENLEAQLQNPPAAEPSRARQPHEIQLGMQPLEAARHALQLTRLEDLAASMEIDDDTAAARGDAASGVLLLLWCLGSPCGKLVVE